ncbi:hypothetical protein PPERSA_00619 [Pseudocohnilembus persalinus]|uniref:Tetratricopeptide repeat protein n=1 Tax=Pseudocohnilembus persalinus TaxID=266149 RepID=A0A0V0QSY3_PSEPJ|nr:hypothetical protein PPERSA_00619 [Pseudocohnilembus persalinus]|eukprot:KRX05318.1 hypothetical protein PPERSA_00619 [Pseudocohnilembus persalinus]
MIRDVGNLYGFYYQQIQVFYQLISINLIYQLKNYLRGWYRNPVDQTDNEFYFGQPIDWISNGTYIYTKQLENQQQFQNIIKKFTNFLKKVCFKTYNISNSSSLYLVVCNGQAVSQIQNYFKNISLKSASITQNAYEDKQYEYALLLYCEVIQIFKHYDNYEILGISYNNIGNIQYYLMKYNESLQYYKCAVEMAILFQKNIDQIGSFTQLNETKQTENMYTSSYQQNQNFAQVQMIYHHSFINCPKQGRKPTISV